MASIPSSRPRLLTVNEVADVMRVSSMTVYRLIHGGELRAVRVGRSYRVPENSLDEYLDGGVNFNDFTYDEIIRRA